MPCGDTSLALVVAVAFPWLSMKCYAQAWGCLGNEQRPDTTWPVARRRSLARAGEPTSQALCGVGCSAGHQGACAPCHVGSAEPWLVDSP